MTCRAIPAKLRAADREAMDYVQITPRQREEMLRAVGAAGINDLLQPLVRGSRGSHSKLNLPPALDEMSLRAHVESLAVKNVTVRDKTCFLGAGAYDHYIPAVVDALASKAEFLTAYSPYQPEASQGALQAFFEFQTMLCQLTGMDVATISLYDGANAAAEAAVMAVHATGKREVLVSEGVHPHWRAVLRARLSDESLARYAETPLKDGHVDTNELEDELDEDTAAIVCQSPNFLGNVEPIETITKFVHANESLMIQAFNPLSLGLLKHPGEMDVDIAVAEGQPLGIPLSYGGPYLGLLAAKSQLVRKMPGHVVGQTVDAAGDRAFCLTLQAREQHVRRDKANSYISTNEGLLAIRAGVYIAALGPAGLRATAQCCHNKAAYLVSQLESRGIRRAFPGRTFFNEVLVRLNEPVKDALARAHAAGMLAGYSVAEYFPQLADCLLIAVTEKRTRAEIDKLVEILTKR
jgi:glycine dehydrogenase subunit 1